MTARCEEQAEGFFKAIAPGLGAFSKVTMDDEHLVLERSDSGLRRRRLDDFVVAAREVADSIGWARTAMATPPEFDEGAVAWREFAASLGGALEPGDMSIQGSFQGLRVATGHRWSDGVLIASTMAIVGLTRQDEEKCFDMIATDDDGLGQADLAAANLDERERDLLGPSVLGAASFVSEREQDVLEIAPELDVAKIKARLAALSRFSRLRGNTAGPYR